MLFTNLDENFRKSVTPGLARVKARDIACSGDQKYDIRSEMWFFWTICFLRPNPKENTVYGTLCRS